MDKKEQARIRKQRQRERDKQRDTTAQNVTQGDVTQLDPWEPILEKVRQHDGGTQVEFTPSELKTILQWGIDEGKIRCRSKVVKAYGLTPRYGPKLLTKDELLAELNTELKQEHKNWDTYLFLLGDVKPRQSLADAFYYSYE